VNRASSQLAAHSHTRQLQAVARSGAMANRAEAEVHRVWDRFLLLLRNASNSSMTHPGPAIVDALHRETRKLFSSLLPAIQATIGADLASVARWGYRTAARNVSRTLPKKYLRAAVALRGQAVREAEPGLIIFQRTSPITATDVLDPFREPADRELTYDDLMGLLFPPPDEATVNDWLRLTLGGQTWYRSLDEAARKAAFGPDQLAAMIAGVYSSGMGQAAIAKAALPFVDGVRYRARRVARTFGLAVAQRSQNAAWEAIDDLIIGFQIHATLDSETRPKAGTKKPVDPLKNHRTRNGMIFYKQPGPGQKGLDEMPNPPHEADGSLAWN